MNEITALTKFGKDKYSVFLDGMYFCTLNAETIIKSGIKVGKFISKEDIETAQVENEKLVAFEKALKYIANIKTQKQVRDYLYTKGYATKTVEYCMAKLNEYKYLNDAEFAKIYVRSYAYKKGKRLMEFELKSKGVDEETAKRVIDEFEGNEDVLYTLAEKYLKNKPRDKKTAQKLSAHLFSKGFEFDDINKVIKKLIYNLDEENDENWN